MYPDQTYSYKPPDVGESVVRKKLALIIAAGVFFLGFLVFSFYQSWRFHIVSTEPLLNKVSTVTPYIKVSFNRPLKIASVTLASTNNIVKSHTVSGDVLTINLYGPLQANKTYTIMINSVQSTDGTTLTNKKITFTAQDLPFSDLPEDQQKAIINSQDQYPAEQQDPILNHLPYSTLDFSLNAVFVPGSNGQSQLTLQAQILLAPGVTGADADTQTAQHKQELLDYIHSLGLDPAKYNIQYQVVNETITGV